MIIFKLYDEYTNHVGYEKWYRGAFNMESKKDYYVAEPKWLYSTDLKKWTPNFIKHRDKKVIEDNP